MLKTCFCKLGDLCYFISSQTPNLSYSINLVITKYELRSQYIKRTQLSPLTLNVCFLSLIWKASHKVVKDLFPHICRLNDYTVEI